MPRPLLLVTPHLLPLPLPGKESGEWFRFLPLPPTTGSGEDDNLREGES